MSSNSPFREKFLSVFFGNLRFDHLSPTFFHFCMVDCNPCPNFLVWCSPCLRSLHIHRLVIGYHHHLVLSKWCEVLSFLFLFSLRTLLQLFWFHLIKYQFSLWFQLILYPVQTGFISKPKQNSENLVEQSWRRQMRGTIFWWLPSTKPSWW